MHAHKGGREGAVEGGGRQRDGKEGARERAVFGSKRREKET